MTITGRARIITYAEVTSNEIGCTTSSESCPDWLYINLNGNGNNNSFGYWTSTADPDNSFYARCVYYNGSTYFIASSHYNRNEDSYGLRPVIELSK